MRTSLTRLSHIEEFLSGNTSPENKLLTEAQLLLDKELATDIVAQQEAYKIIRICSRQSLKSELEILHVRLQSDSKLKSFWESIHKIFQKN